MKKFICFSLSVVMLIGMICMTGWTTGDIWSPEAFDEKTPSNYSKTDEVIASNSNYELVWKGSDCTVDLIEKATGNRWGVTPQLPAQESETEGEEVSSIVAVKTKPEAASAIVLESLDMSNNQTSLIFSQIGAVKNGRVVTEKIENGIRAYYYFDAVQIRVAADFVLHDNRVTITVDPKLLQENDKYRAVSVRIAPYWCSNVNDDASAYLFYPSGSGAIISNTSLSSAGTTYESQVYGFDFAMLQDTQETTTKEIRVPVYGAVNGNLGAVAIIEDNAEAAHIGTKVGSTTLGFSGVYTKFDLRGHSTNAVQTMNNGSSRQEVYAVSPAEKPITVGFYPLKDDKASYSGMVETYKNYLKSAGAFKENIKEESPLNVTFLGGVMIDKSFLGVPYKDLVAATTITKAQEILTELNTKTGSKISAKLLGFGSTGIENGSYAGGITLHKNIGSKKQLTALADYAKNNNIDLYYDFDLVKLKNASKGFSTTFDVAYSSLLKITTVYKYHAASRSYVEETGYKLLKRELLDKGANKVLKGISNWGLGGVSLESLSQMAYSDCSTETTEYMTKGNMAKDVTALFAKFGEKYKIASEDANAYAAVASNIIFNAPSVSGQERIFKYDIPFYQMIFKGYVAMTGESLNLASDPEKELLTAVETGSGLNYTLISDYYNEFIDYQGYLFFGSQYNGISDSIIETSNALKDYYKAINGAEIKTHTILESGLRETVYSNGVKAYVNYTDVDLATPSGKTVAAKGYVWEK